MKKQWFSLLTLLAFAILLAAPTGPIAANGPVATHFTGVENGACSVCGVAGLDEIKPLPNEKNIIRSLVMVIEFQSEEPLFNGLTTATFYIKPGTTGMTPINGIWHLQPYGIDGYWEGPVIAITTPTSVRSVYSGKGYGDLDGMIIHGTNVNGQLSGEIIELP